VGGAAPAGARARALRGAAALDFMAGDWAAARPRFEESLALFREVDDRRGVAEALQGLGSMAMNEDPSLARARLEESLAAWQQLPDERGTAGAAGAIAGLGAVAYLQGDYAAARARYEEALAIRRRSGIEPLGAESLPFRLADVALAQGDLPAARATLEEHLRDRSEAADHGRRSRPGRALAEHGCLQPARSRRTAQWHAP
jgi:tetratricopeptide (TPR) repeat protein